jgi:hypothetical protein
MVVVRGGGQGGKMFRLVRFGDIALLLFWFFIVIFSALWGSAASACCCFLFPFYTGLSFLCFMEAFVPR